jgi:hypothetical protein
MDCFVRTEEPPGNVSVLLGARNKHQLDVLMPNTAGFGREVHPGNHQPCCTIDPVSSRVAPRYLVSFLDHNPSYSILCILDVSIIVVPAMMSFDPLGNVTFSLSARAVCL